MPVSLLAALSLLALLAAGCSQGGNGLDTSLPPTGSTASSSAPPAADTVSAPATTPSGAPSFGDSSVTLTGFERNAIAKAFARYAIARHRAAMSYDGTLPAFVAAVTPRWQQYQAGVFATSKAKGWTWPPVPRYAVLQVSRTGPTTARVRDCLWGPSGGLVVARTGQWAETVQPKWYAEDTRMVLSNGTWRVDQVFDASVPGRLAFSCKGAR